VAVPEGDGRIVSLIPAATEIVGRLGLDGRLVGRSHECDTPAWVKRLPALTAPRIDDSRASGEIHAQVKARAAEALSIYAIDWARMQALAPEIVITQDQCAACGVTLADLEHMLAEWTGTRPEVVSLNPHGLRDVWRDIERVAEAAGVGMLGKQVTAQLADRVDTLARRGADLDRPSVMAVEWFDPPMAAGHWVPTLIDVAGGRDVLGVPDAHAAVVTWAQVREANPDVLVMMPCGFDIARTRRELPVLTRQPGWTALTAVRHGRVALTDGNSFFNRPGPRLVESAEILAEILHPETFAFGHAGRHWILLDA
jgi:iron complex transport system substrate-binding protein